MENKYNEHWFPEIEDELKCDECGKGEPVARVSHLLVCIDCFKIDKPKLSEVKNG